MLLGKPRIIWLISKFYVFSNELTAEISKSTTYRYHNLSPLYLQEELLAVLTMMVGANISPEQLLSISERTILEADQDNDDLISFEEFANVLERTDVEQKMSIRFLN